MSTPDPCPLGVPFAVGEVFVEALRAEFEPEVKVVDNPLRPSELTEDGARVVWFEDVSDGPAVQGEQVKREFRFTIGVLNRSSDSRRAVHTDYRRAKRVIDQAIRLIKQGGVPVTTNYLREGDVAFRLENVDVGAGLILATFTYGYRDPGFRTV